MYISTLDSPIGKIQISANDREVYAIFFTEQIQEDNPNDITALAKLQFEEYFEGKRIAFDFQMAQSGTEFQQSVWNELKKIEAGFPISYAALSKRLKNPLAIRAIASANGRNNLIIAIPCHRVIGSNGDLVGFSAGLWRKKWLLEHEAVIRSIGQTCLNF